MTIGNTISNLRKEKGLTQEALAQALNVTNQAVSKWESNQCCPDTMLLPVIADYFEISIDELFGRPHEAAAAALPWDDDEILRAVIFRGHRLLKAQENPVEELHFVYKGEAMNIESCFSVQCDEVRGNVTAGGDVNCDTVLGSVSAGGGVRCDDIRGSVSAGGNVACDNISGNVTCTGRVNYDTHGEMEISEDWADQISDACEKFADSFTKNFPFGGRR